MLIYNMYNDLLQNGNALPSIGAIFDHTKTYTVSFLVAGGLIAVAGMVALPVRRVASWEERRWGAGGDAERTRARVVDEVDVSE